MCAEPPGYPDDGVVTRNTASLVRWYAGQLTLGAAQRSGGMTVTAPRWLERELARWGRLSPYIGIEPRHATTTTA